jgi:hypothetical protein
VAHFRGCFNAGHFHIADVLQLQEFWVRSQDCERRLLDTSCLSVCPSVRMEQLGSHSTDFQKLAIWVFSKVCRENSFHLNLTNMTVTWHEDQYTFVTISRSFLLRMRNVSEKHYRENQNIHFVWNNFFKSRLLWDNVEKYRIAGQATDGNTAHAHCMLDNLGHKHTIRICYTYSFSTATMVTFTRLSVKVYIHCLSWIICGPRAKLGPRPPQFWCF